MVKKHKQRGKSLVTPWKIHHIVTQKLTPTEFNLSNMQFSVCGRKPESFCVQRDKMETGHKTTSDGTL